MLLKARSAIEENQVVLDKAEKVFETVRSTNDAINQKMEDIYKKWKEEGDTLKAEEELAKLNCGKNLEYFNPPSFLARRDRESK